VAGRPPRRCAAGRARDRRTAGGRRAESGRGQKSLIGGGLEASRGAQSPAIEVILLSHVKECEEFWPALST
jgi:hypothetical protein